MSKKVGITVGVLFILVISLFSIVILAVNDRPISFNDEKEELLLNHEYKIQYGSMDAIILVDSLHGDDDLILITTASNLKFVFINEYFTEVLHKDDQVLLYGEEFVVEVIFDKEENVINFNEYTHEVDGSFAQQDCTVTNQSDVYTIEVPVYNSETGRKCGGIFLKLNDELRNGL